MMADAEPSLNIFATDIRPAILLNLEERFNKVGIKKIKTRQFDLTLPLSNFQFPTSNFQSTISNPQFGILADVPCTGSGTWARTPEWLTMFDEKSVAHFITLQRNIILNLASVLKAGQPLVYITCSVFKEENELNVKWIEANTKLSLQKSGYITGLGKQADTMFTARFILKENG